MKIGKLLLTLTLSLLSVGITWAQDAKEKDPNSLNGIWQMCFYRSASPDIPGELKTSNSLKILADDGNYYNLVMMPQGAIIIGYGTYSVPEKGVLAEKVEKNIHLPQLNGQRNDLHFELREGGDLMYVKYFLKNDIHGNEINSWNYEIWKRVEMPDSYPENIIR
ncbi:DUF4488 domain-containing protein [uncultured Bacteroides sp.]|uniref:DUF4488 domain-containing protein n=1 Tax=uncultured Bacteroides sp. TaxID=162156 RepID=UPI00263456FE|nr:DUF4488 domain-containing protein [uncultured Bacteroides sp.]